MAQTIIIIMLALLSVGTIVMLIFTAKNQSDNIADLYESYDRMRNNYTESIAKQNELNTSYSKSLDERERSLNDFNIRIKKLELELEAKNAEIEKLRSRIAVIELPVDIAKITKVDHTPLQEENNGN